jgi:hypothetical protein
MENKNENIIKENNNSLLSKEQKEKLKQGIIFNIDLKELLSIKNAINITITFLYYFCYILYLLKKMILYY